jgi:2,3-bisphosphoglycerate-dependent phosphoglycerate mutase
LLFEFDLAFEICHLKFIAMDHTLILLRHGQSIWNKENRFTGWTDVPLTDEGREEAREAARLVAEESFIPDIIFTSILDRGIETTNIFCETMQIHPEIRMSWRLNERHYGALQGLNKAETALKYGEDQVLQWRRSYTLAPPPLSDEAYKKECEDPVFQSIPVSDHPRGETLKNTVERVIPYWEKEIAPMIHEGKTVMVSSHHNSLRAIVKILESISDDEIIHLTIPTGVPLLYTLDDMRVIGKRYLGDQEKIRKAIELVEQQGKK